MYCATQFQNRQVLSISVLLYLLRLAEPASDDWWLTYETNVFSSESLCRVLHIHEAFAIKTFLIPVDQHPFPPLLHELHILPMFLRDQVYPSEGPICPGGT